MRTSSHSSRARDQSNGMVLAVARRWREPDAWPRLAVLGLVAMCAATILMLSYGRIAGHSPVTMAGGIFVMSLFMLDVLCDVAGRHRSPNKS